jgi:ubiquinol-cytochrome c reductase cytochrome b subunit
VLPHVHTSLVRSTQFRPIAKVWYWIFVANFILLTWIGGLPVESPYIEIGQACAVLYFAYFLVITPLVGKIENKLLYNI